MLGPVIYPSHVPLALQTSPSILVCVKNIALDYQCFLQWKTNNRGQNIVPRYLGKIKPRYLGKIKKEMQDPRDYAQLFIVVMAQSKVKKLFS